MKTLGIFKDKKDNTIKCTFSQNGKIIEMSLLKNRKDTDVVCAPTHHFCNLGCKMCHLTNNKLNKKMVPINTDDFIEALSKTVCNQKTYEKRTDKQKLLISFMGVGEPLLNIDLIIDIYNKRDKIKKLGYKEIGFALASILPSDEKFKELEKKVLENKIPLKIHFSMHTPIDKKRKELIPATSVDVKTALLLLSRYSEKIKNDKEIMKLYKNFHKTDDIVEIHYALIENVNDSINELLLIKDYLNKYNITLKFIKFNPINELSISTNKENWINYLRRNTNARIKSYSPPGKEVGSSCGEFTKHYYHEEIETDKEKQKFEEWKKAHQIFD